MSAIEEKKSGDAKNTSISQKSTSTKTKGRPTTKKKKWVFFYLRRRLENLKFLTSFSMLQNSKSSFLSIFLKM